MERSASSSICSQGQSRGYRPRPGTALAPTGSLRDVAPAPPPPSSLLPPPLPHGSMPPSRPWFRSPSGSGARNPPPGPRWPPWPELRAPSPAPSGPARPRAGRAWLARPRRTHTDAPSPRAARGTSGPRPLPCYWPAARPPAFPPSAHWLLRSDVTARALLTGPRGQRRGRLAARAAPLTLPGARFLRRRPARAASRDPRPLPAGASRRFPAPSRRGEHGPRTTGRSCGRLGPPFRRRPVASQAAVPGAG